MTQKLLFLSQDFRARRRPRVSRDCSGARPFPIQKLFSRPPRAPRLPGLPGAVGRREPSREAARGGCIAGPGRWRGLPSPRPGACPHSSEGPRVPANLPRGGCSAPAPSPTSSRAGSSSRVWTRWPTPAHPRDPLAHRYLHPHRRPPPAPFLTERPWSSFAWLPQRRLRTWREVGAPGFRNDAALAGPAPGWGPRGGSGSGFRGRCAQPALQVAADPNPAPTATTCH